MLEKNHEDSNCVECVDLEELIRNFKQFTEFLKPLQYASRLIKYFHRFVQNFTKYFFNADFSIDLTLWKKDYLVKLICKEMI